MSDVIEVAKIKLADGKSEAELIAASDAFQSAFLSQQDGFISRELVKNADGTFADIVRWQSMEAAHAIMEKMESSEACGAYFAVMDMSGDPMAGVHHYSSLRQY